MLKNSDEQKSPPGFAAVILIDESHVTAIVIQKLGLLARCVYCGNNDPQIIVDNLKELFSEKIEGIKLLEKRKLVDL